MPYVGCDADVLGVADELGAVRCAGQQLWVGI
jgi:hypothetical protein